MLALIDMAPPFQTHDAAAGFHKRANRTTALLRCGRRLPE